MRHLALFACFVLAVSLADASVPSALAASPGNIMHVGTKYTLQHAVGRAIRFSPDGKSLAVAGYTKSTPSRQIAMLLDRTGANLWSTEAAADFQNGRSSGLTGLTFDPNGSVLTVGPCFDEFYRFGFSRFSDGGELDPTFNASWGGFDGEPVAKGRVVHTPSQEGFYLDQLSIPQAVEIKKIESRWRIVAAGHTGTDDDSRAVVAQLHPNGELDESFGNDPGERTGFFTSDLKSIPAVAANTARGATNLLMQDGRLLVCGNLILKNRWQAFVIRLTEDGQIDSTFNGNTGIALLPFGIDVEAKAFSMCTIQDKKNVYIGGYSRRHGKKEGWRLSAACISADGKPREVFGGRSSTIAPSAVTYQPGNDDPSEGPKVGVLADDTVILAGEVTTKAGPTIGLVALSPNAAWAVERPGIPHALAISSEPDETIAICASSPGGSMSVEFYKRVSVPITARK